MVLSTHFKNMTPNVESGDWKMGGMFLHYEILFSSELILMVCRCFVE